MRQPKVYILHRKNHNDDEDRAKEIRKVIMTAGQMVGKIVDIEFSTNAKEFDGVTVKPEDMPVVIINNFVVFSKQIPPVEFIKQQLATPEEQQKYF